ncbi:hypothetical protein FGO68_gene3912 [Halteria grandinella]|uniref:Uncharacterized protein n=1 Tax=Halteria grandinella TaxID=5974 RepID=A0A8J8N902_HALGN|nr:hypothetical protein FGO68_gene3912 [Halteria grandinella]
MALSIDQGYQISLQSWSHVCTQLRRWHGLARIRGSLAGKQSVLDIFCQQPVPSAQTNVPLACHISSQSMESEICDLLWPFPYLIIWLQFMHAWRNKQCALSSKPRWLRGAAYLHSTIALDL